MGGLNHVLISIFFQGVLPGDCKALQERNPGIYRRFKNTTYSKESQPRRSRLW